MNAALCTTFLEEDVWERRLLLAAAPHTMEITVRNTAGALLPVLELKPFSLLIVALNGVAGLDAVRKIREKAPDAPLLWISDEDFSLLSYQYRVTHFLCRPVPDTALREAVLDCLRLREE